MARQNSTIGVFSDLTLGDGNLVHSNFAWIGEAGGTGTPVNTGLTPTVEYQTGDLVVHNGGLWIASHPMNMTNDNYEPGLPTSANFWTEVGGGDNSHIEAFDPLGTYRTGDTAYLTAVDGDQGARLYVYTGANQIMGMTGAGNMLTSPDESNDWVQISDTSSQFRARRFENGVPVASIEEAGGVTAISFSDNATGIAALESMFRAFNLTVPAVGADATVPVRRALTIVVNNIMTPSAAVINLPAGTVLRRRRASGGSTNDNRIEFDFILDGFGGGFYAPITGQSITINAIGTQRMVNPTIQGAGGIELQWDQVNDSELTISVAAPVGEMGGPIVVTTSADGRTNTISLEHDATLEVVTTGTDNNLSVNLAGNESGLEKVLTGDAAADGIQVHIDSNMENDLDVSDDGLRVVPHSFESEAITGNTNAARLRLQGGSNTNDTVNIITGAAPATPTSGETGTTVTRATNGDIVVTGPDVAAWAQDFTGGVTIPANKLPNLELGNTHTYTGAPATPETPGTILLTTTDIAASAQVAGTTIFSGTGAAEPVLGAAAPAAGAFAPVTQWFAGAVGANARTPVPYGGGLTTYANTEFSAVDSGTTVTISVRAIDPTAAHNSQQALDDLVSFYTTGGNHTALFIAGQNGSDPVISVTTAPLTAAAGTAYAAPTAGTPADVSGTPGILAAMEVTTIYTSATVDGTRTALNTTPFAAGTMIQWADGTDSVLVTVSGTDAAALQTALDGLDPADGVNFLFLDDTDDTPRISSTNVLTGSIPTGGTYVPGSGPMAGALLNDVVANAGGQRDGNAPIEWHPGDLLVLSGAMGDSANNGIYVFVGPDQSTGGADSPLEYNLNGDTYPAPRTDAQNTETFEFNFRVVISSDTEVQTTVSQDNTSRGSLNNVNYDTMGDVIEFENSAGNTVSVNQARHLANDATVTQFINRIKIGGVSYIFGVEPDAPTFTLGNFPAGRLYSANDYSESVGFTLTPSSTATFNGRPVTLADYMLVETGANAPTSTITPNGPANNADAATVTYDATNDEFDVVIPDTQTNAGAIFTVNGDVNYEFTPIDGFNYDVNDDATITFTDQRTRPSVAGAGTTSAPLQRSVFDGSDITFTITSNAGDSAIAAGMGFDIAGYRVTSHDETQQALVPITPTTGALANYVQSVDSVFFDNAQATRTADRDVVFAFPMQGTPRNGQPGTSPMDSSYRRRVQFLREWGYVAKSDAVNPTATEIRALRTFASNNRTYTGTSAGSSTNGITLVNNANDVLFIVIPTGDVTPNTQIRVGIPQSSTLSPATRVGTQMVETAIAGVNIEYTIFRVAGTRQDANDEIFVEVVTQ